jgi:hypothetical protein
LRFLPLHPISLWHRNLQWINAWKSESQAQRALVPMLQIVRSFPKILSDGVVPIDHTAFRLHNAKLPPHIGRVTQGIGERPVAGSSSNGWSFRRGTRWCAGGSVWTSSRWEFIAAVDVTRIG